MLWLIWIAMMLAVPVVAGVQVWMNLRNESSEPALNQEEIILS